MSNNETLADILAEMREGCVFAWEGCKFEGLADRIEAAYARDTGNAAALREALLSVRKAIDYRGGDLARYTLPVIDAALKTPPEPAGNAAMMRMALEVLWDVIGQFSNNFLDGQMQLVLSDRLIPAKNAYHHALAAPPRNCDRYATWKDAWDAFADAYFGPTDPGEMEYSFGVWLFAKAKEAPNGQA